MTPATARRGLFAIVLTICFAGALAAEGADTGVRRFGIFVGANDGGADRVTLRYAVSDAARLAEVMYEVGGVQPRDSVLLRDPDRDDIERSVARIAREVARAREEARRVEFVFYYSGHSDETGLLLGDQRFHYRDLRGTIAAVDADVAVAMLDSCSSGSFTRLKGGRRAQPFLIGDSSDMSGYAFLTSSSDDEASQESDEIGASFFTHYLVSGLLGAADSTGDGMVTLNEVYQYAFTETLARTAATFAGPQHPSYEIQLTGAGDLILTDLAQGSAAVELASDVSGRVFLRDEDRGRIVAEFEKYAGAPMSIAVVPGAYRVELREADGMYVAFVDAAPGGVVAVGTADFSSLRLERNRLRGGGAAAGTFERVWDHTTGAVRTAGQAARGAFTGGDAGSPSFVPADRAELVREPFVLDILPGIRVLPRESVPEGESVHNLVIGLPVAEAGYTDGVVASFGLNMGTGITRGWEWSYIGNIRRGRVHGVQQSSIFNVHAGEIRGVQTASVVNVTDGNVWGLQGAGVANIVDGEIRGVQAAGVANVTGYRVRGTQFAGVVSSAPEVGGLQMSTVNIAREVTGAQVGVVNLAESVRGAQVGVINIAEEVDGATLGLLNIVRFGILDLALTVDDRGTTWLAFENGTELLYTVYHLGLRQPNLETNEVEVTTGIGLGTRVWSGTLYLDLDLSAMVQGAEENGFDYRGPRVFPSFRVSGGIQFGPNFAIMGGVRLDALLTYADQEPLKTHRGPELSVMGEGIDVYPHVFLGVKI